MKQDIKSVLKPRTHFAILLSPDSTTEHELKTFYDAIERLKDIDFTAHIAATIMIDHACRVSEVLKIEPKDILPEGSIKIVAGKKGNTRVIKCREFESFFLRCKANNVRPFEFLTRFRMYDLFKRVGLVLPSGQKKYKKVTHALRHAKAQFLQKSGIEEKDIQTHLAQKSINSTKHYLSK